MFLIISALWLISVLSILSFRSLVCHLDFKPL